MASDIVGFLRENGIEPQLAEGQTYVASQRPAAPPVSPAKPSGGYRVRDAGSFTVKVPEKWSVLDGEVLNSVDDK